METTLFAHIPAAAIEPALWIMALFGAAWSTLFWFSTDVLAQFLAEADVKRLYRKDAPKALEGAKGYIRGKNRRGVFGAWGLLLLPTLPILAAFIPLSASPLFFGGFALATTALSFIDGKRWMRNFRLGASKRILRFFLSNGQRDEIDTVMEEVYLQEPIKQKVAAIQSMGKWGSDRVILLLKEASESPDPYLAEVADTVYRQVLKRLGEAQPLSVKTLETYFQEYEYWHNEAEENAALPEERARFLAKRDSFKRRIEEIIQSQMHLRNASPDLYCMECYTFSEEVVYRHWRYVRCKTCKEATNLQRGIRTTIGRIGPIPTVNPSEEGIYYLPMWDPAKTKAQPGEVEKIEILPGAEFNYDWAVSAVAEAMQNRFPDQNLSIPIIVDPDLELNSNTLNVLSNISRSIRSPRSTSRDQGK